MEELISAADKKLFRQMSCSRHCVTLTFAERNHLALSLSGNKPLSAMLIDAFFQVKLKLPLSKLLSTLNVIIDFGNHFRLAECALIADLI